MMVPLLPSGTYVAIFSDDFSALSNIYSHGSVVSRRWHLNASALLSTLHFSVIAHRHWSAVLVLLASMERIPRNLRTVSGGLCTMSCSQPVVLTVPSYIPR